MRAVGFFVLGALSTLAVLGGGFLIVVGIAFLAASGDSWFGGDFAAIGLLSLLFGLLLLAAGVVGWRRLWRLRDLPPEAAGEQRELGALRPVVIAALGHGG
jgi:hypothetical protein